MPWWSYLYLGLFALATIGGVADDWRRPHRVFFVAGEIVSVIFVGVFVAAFFHPSLAQALGWLIFVMLGAGMVYELSAAQRVMNEHKHDSRFTEKENSVLNNVGLLLGNLFIVPGYVFGLAAGLRNANV